MASIAEVLDKIIKQYQPGGDFGKGELALLGRAKTKAMAGVGQQLVGAGLAGTTAGAGATQRWEEEIGMPARLKLEDVRTERLVQAMLAKAGFMQEERQMLYERQEAERQRKFEQERTMGTGRFRPPTDVGPSPWEAGFLGGGWGVTGGAQPQAGAGTGTHLTAGADFTVGGAAGTADTQTAGPTPTTKVGHEIYGPMAGDYITAGGEVARRAPITAAAPGGERGPITYLYGSPEEYERLKRLGLPTTRAGAGAGVSSSK